MAQNIVFQINAELGQFAEKKIKELTLEVTSNLIEDTPVDTGWARANWVPNIGAEVQDTSGSREQAELGNINLQPQQLGLAEVATTYKLNKGAVYISNKVPYIGILNNGSSSQAPSGFVQAGIAKAVQDVSRRVRR